MSCATYEERAALNKATPCANKWESVFPAAIAKSVTPAILLVITSLIGSAVARRRSWAVNGLVKKNAVLTLAVLSAVANQLSSVYDHSRVSDEPYCLTSSIPGYNAKTNKMAFGALGAISAFFSVKGVIEGNWDTVALAGPGLVLSAYQVVTKTDPRSCKSNAATTGLLSFATDILSLSGIFATLGATSENKRAFALYTVAVAVATIGLICSASYPKRVKDDCTIDDAADNEEAKKRRTPEFVSQLVLSAANALFVMYALLHLKGFGCCAAYPALGLLAADLLLKFEFFNNRMPLVGSGMTRTNIYGLIQLLDVFVSTQSIVSILLPHQTGAAAVGSVGALGASAALSDEALATLDNLLPPASGLMRNIGFLYYLRMIGAAFVAAYKSNAGSEGSARRLFSALADIGGSLFPFAIDTLNASSMVNDDPRILNLACYIR
jgi:hypothetical protein